MSQIYYEEQQIRDQKFQSDSLEDYRFVDCTFENCAFEDCNILRCAFVNCTFYNCNIIALTAQHSEVKNAVFQNCNLIGIHCWNSLLPGGRYSQLMERLQDCCVKYNSFTEIPFRRFNFSGNLIQESSFEECDLQESCFKNCRLEATQFSHCDLRKADFTDAQGYMINILTNKIKQAKFSFPEVVNLLDALEIKIQ